MSDSPPICPDCGSPLPADSPQALCPACLMRQVLASRTVVPGADQRPVGPPPSPEEIADRFPQFEILECLGRGGMGVVYKARQKSLNRLVAIKILAPERGHESRFAERFAREAELLAKLNHPHIVTIHDFGVTDFQPSTLNSQPLYFLVMEFVDGVNLRDLLREGKLEPKQAIAIVPPICEALQYAHDKGIVHRDIKPENLLLDREGRIKIADFGIAALMGSEGEEAGTPPYMAPEQSGRSSCIDHRADLYALGVVLYEMLTGERPTMDLVAPSRKVQIDVRLDEMVLRALEKTPELRYQTAAEFRTVVETLATPLPGRETSNGERRKKRRKKVVFSLPDPLPSKGALLVRAVAALGVGVLLFLFGESVWEELGRWTADFHRFRQTAGLGLILAGGCLAVGVVGGLLIRARTSPASSSWRARIWSGLASLLVLPGIVMMVGWLLVPGFPSRLQTFIEDMTDHAGSGPDHPSAEAGGVANPVPGAINRLTEELNATGGMWINGLSPSLDLPPTAGLEEVMLRIIAVNRLGTNVRTLELRKDWPIQVAASGGDRFTAALVETDSGKRIILFRWEGNAWWSRVFELP